MTRTRLSKDDLLEQQIVRSLGRVALGVGDVGEILAVAERISDRGAWGREWRGLATRVQGIAETAEARGHARSAGEAFMRAHEYWRQAYFLDRADLADPALHHAWRSQRECFRRALVLLGVPHRIVEIPFEDTVLDGYVFTPGGEGPHPTIVSMPGYDSPLEESYTLAGVVPALARGYAVVLFEGPGQGGALYEKGLVMRPDFERVLIPVIDWILAQGLADPARIALLGRSFGGYLGPRGATGESRLAALIVDPGQIDLGSAVRTQLPGFLAGLVERRPPRAEQAFRLVFARSPGLRFALMSRAAAHGISSPVEYIREMRRYTLREQVERIACPTLVCSQPGDVQSKALYDALRCPKQLALFTSEEGAGGHCEGAAQTLFFQRALDWLDEVLADPGSPERRG